MRTVLAKIPAVLKAAVAAFKAVAGKGDKSGVPFSQAAYLEELATAYCNCWPDAYKNGADAAIAETVALFSHPEYGRQNQSVYMSQAMERLWKDYVDLMKSDIGSHTVCKQIELVERLCRAGGVLLVYPTDFVHPVEIDRDLRYSLTPMQ